LSSVSTLKVHDGKKPSQVPDRRAVFGVPSSFKATTSTSVTGPLMCRLPLTTWFT
jgi:hypothetical protein